MTGVRKANLGNLGFATAAAGIALAFVLISIRVWNASLDIPFEYYWDSLFAESQIKGAIDNGSFLFNPDLGAPYGQDSVDFYQGGITTFLVAMFLGLFTDSWALVTNLIWLAGFAAVGATAWWAMHSLGIPRLPALVGAVLFAILPYHFWRGEAHLLLSGYFVVPLAGWLILRTLRGGLLFGAKVDGTERGTGRVSWRVAGIGLVCLLIGLGSIYYAVFSILLLGVVSLLVLLARDRRRAGLIGLATTALIVLITLASLAPSLVFRAENGSNPEAGNRIARDSDSLGLSLSQMIMPATNHRWQELADAKQRFLSETIAPSEDAQSLGLLGTIGLIACLVGVLTLPIGRPKWAEPLLSDSGVAILVTFLIGTVGGGAILIATFVTPQIRAWNRLSVFIGFFALVGLALLLARVFAFVDERTGRAAPSFMLGGLLLLFGLWDQTPARWPEQFQHDLIAREFKGDQALVERMEEVLPDDALVFQVPYLEYPGDYPPPGRMDDLDPLRGYLHSKDLGWNYGALRARAADISFCVRDLPIPRLIDVIHAWGFSALWLDLYGYSKEKAAEQAALARGATGSDPLRDPSGRFLVFPLDKETEPPRVRRLLRESLPGDGSALRDCAPIRRAIAEADL